ncbi:MAG: polysaccharide deacetylase family protein [Ignavibacteria bacterium]|nr:polysaccharide deacetylase family protein [Ignavibacteria bacterium]
MKQYAWISIDVDSVSSHLQGYGITDSSDTESIYRLAIPRAVRLFDRLGVRCTFFLIASEAAQQREAVRSLIGAGHEVASHSMTHPVPFIVPDDEAIQRELIDSRTLLEDLSGSPVVGFRAPGWDAEVSLTTSLAEAGYLYDASAYPSWVLSLLRRAIARRSAGMHTTQRGGGGGVWDNPEPYRVDTPAGRISEFPISTTPLVRLPYYHTLRFLLPRAGFTLIHHLVHLRRFPVGYVFHAVDFLDQQVDRLDSRITRHPGMTVPLETKLQLAEEAVVAMMNRRTILPLRDLAAWIHGPAAPAPGRTSPRHS